ncbi:MAG: prolipoprotein diacylglyceryl transferase [Boseongicola sp. SB0662_bin_57]|nr:prolipoprotein diacylglyceryl transferase [Boseongicola sp. SB0662_bin_57]
MQHGIPFPDISPILVEIPLGPINLPIRWYALAYIAGIMAGYWILRRTIGRPQLWKGESPALDRKQLDDFLVWLILGVVLGGRLGYVLFYGRGQALEDPLSILRVWEGGMSFHGGLLGVAVAAAVFAYRHGLPLTGLADGLALATPPGLFLGRIANFINAELWGKPTDLPWGVIFPGSAAQNCPGVAGACARHPSQIYEAGLEGLVLGVLILWLAYARGWLKRPGAIVGIFIAGYGASRFAVEFFRQADSQFVTAGNPMGHVAFAGPVGVTMGQLLSLPMIAFGLLALYLAFRPRP